MSQDSTTSAGLQLSAFDTYADGHSCASQYTATSTSALGTCVRQFL